MSAFLDYLKRLLWLLGLIASGVIFLLPNIASDLLEHLRVFASGCIFSLSILEGISQLLGRSLFDVLRVPCEKASLVTAVDIQPTGILGAFGYVLILENRGDAMAEDVRVACSTTGDLRLDQSSFNSRSIAGHGGREVFQPVYSVGLNRFSLDQDLKVKVSWKQGLWRRKGYEESFNLRRIDEEYRRRALAQRWS